MLLNVRRKGHNLERSDVLDLKPIFPFAVTARYGSKLSDDCGIDIINIPFAWQCKAGYPKGINYIKLIAGIEATQLEKLPQQLPVIIHHKAGRKVEQNNIIMRQEIFLTTFVQHIKSATVTFKPELVIVNYRTFLIFLTDIYATNRKSTRRMVNT